MKSDDFIANGNCGRLRASFGHTGGREVFFRRIRRRKNNWIVSPPAGGELCEAYFAVRFHASYASYNFVFFSTTSGY